MEMIRKTSLALIGLILMASVAMAQGTSDAEIVISLEQAPSSGQQYDAVGVAAKITKNGVEMFVTKVAAACEDGTILVVRGYSSDRKVFDIGTIEMLLGSGSLELKSTKDPSQVFPLAKLMAVTVESRNGLLLEGKFGR
jgi:hypothetical protein